MPPIKCMLYLACWRALYVLYDPLGTGISLSFAGLMSGPYDATLLLLLDAERMLVASAIQQNLVHRKVGLCELDSVRLIIEIEFIVIVETII